MATEIVEIVEQIVATVDVVEKGPKGDTGADATLPTSVTQAEAEAGTEVTDRMWSPERVRQAGTSPVESIGTVVSTLTIDFTGKPNKALTATLGSADCTVSVTNTIAGAYATEFNLILTTGATIPTVMTWTNMTNPPTLVASKVYEINGRSVDGVNYRLLTVEVV